MLFRSIIACLLIPIIGVGLYPKILTQVYDSTTVAYTDRLRNSVPTLMKSSDVAQIDSTVVSWTAPKWEQ